MNKILVLGLLFLNSVSYAFTAQEAKTVAIKQARIAQEKVERLRVALLQKDRKALIKAIRNASNGGALYLYVTCDRVYSKNGDYLRSLGYTVQDSLGVCIISWE